MYEHCTCDVANVAPPAPTRKEGLTTILIAQSEILDILERKMNRIMEVMQGPRQEQEAGQLPLLGALEHARSNLNRLARLDNEMTGLMEALGVVE